jgi:hypothetical protein
MKKKFKPYIAKQVYDPDYLKGGDWSVAASKRAKKPVEKKAFLFTWEYCAQCDTMMVRCPMCGNNCCNAGFGKIKGLFEPTHFGDKKSISCPVCNLAYQFQHLGWKHKDYPKATRKVKAEAKRKNKEYWEKNFGAI